MRAGRGREALNPDAPAPRCPVRELEPGGELSTTRSYPFEFNNVEMPYEAYNGVNVRLKCAPQAPRRASRSLAHRLLQVHDPRHYHPAVQHERGA